MSNRLHFVLGGDCETTGHCRLSIVQLVISSILVTSALPHACGASPSVEAGHVKIVSASRVSIYSGDVSLRVTTTFPLKTQATAKNGVEHYRWVPWEASETPKQIVKDFQQLFSVDGRYSVTQKGEGQQKTNVDALLAYDGKIERRLFPILKEGYLGKRSTHMVTDNHDYTLLTHCVYGLVTLEELLVSRLNVASSSLLKDGDSTILAIEIPPAAGTSLPQFAFSVRLRGDRGYALESVEMRDSTKNNALLNKMRVMNWKLLDDGAWAPIEGLIENHNTIQEDPTFGKVVNKVHLKVSVPDSMWNFPVDDSMFTFDFPSGFKVIDKVNNFTYKTGKVLPGEEIDSMITKASGHVRNEPRPMAPLTANMPDNIAGHRFLLWLNVFIVLALVGLLLKRHIKAKGTT